MAIETLTLLDGTKKYRGKIGRVIDGKRKVYNTPYVIVIIKVPEISY